MDTERIISRVFVTNFSGHNFRGAKEYGELRSMTRGYVSFESLDRLKYDLFTVILHETTKDDWLLLSGIQALSAMCAALWYAHHKCLKLLIWDKKKVHNGNPIYREVIIDEENYLDMLRELS